MNIHKTIRAAAVAAAFSVAGTAVSAAVIDFTAADASNSGTISGTSYVVTSAPLPTNNDQAFDGGVPANSFGLAFDTDGFGITGSDEISIGESITVTFARAVRITGFAFLDLFRNLRNGDTPTGEYGTLTSGLNSFSTFFNEANAGNGGYSEFLLGDSSFTTTSVTFTVGDTNDQDGVADGALAALEVAPIPVPAAGLLLLTALGGVAALRRRKSA